MHASIIDMWAPIVPVPELMAHIAENFPDAMLGYLRVFWKQPPSQDALRVGAPLVARHPGRFVAFAGVDIMRGASAVRELEHWVRERGFRGLSLRPFMINLPADDRHYYPFYEKCVELDVPVSIHASANWTTERPSDLGHPRHFDQVACD